MLTLILILTGCNEKKEEISNEEPKVEEEQIVVDNYQDLNNTKIGLYIEKYGKLTLIDEYKTIIENDVDAGVFQIYPSNEK